LKAYADTSFLVCLYVSEAERSPKAIRYMRRQAEALPFTPWHRLEFRNAIRARLREKLLSERERRQVFAQLENDLDEEVFLLHQPLDWTNCLRGAEALGTTHAERLNIRASDLFHVACEFELGLSEFLTFDVSQRALAQAAGLRTPP
jgi:predicted nucleic acid-binding protein